MQDLAGKTAFITGGASGLGLAMAHAFGAAGMNVMLADIETEPLARAVAELEARQVRVAAVQCDVTDRAALVAAARETVAAFGKVHVVCNNAGVGAGGAADDMKPADWDWTFQVNLMGVINTTRAFLPGMIAAGGGHVCATASMAGLLPGWIPVHVPYSAAKAGIIGFTMNLGLEMREHNVFTTSYCPGGVATGMKANNATYRPEKFGGPGQGEVEITEASKAHTSMDFYTPEAIAPIVLDAVRNNRPLVFDHPEQRVNFRETYSGVVEACYDAADAWEAAHGKPEANPHGAMLIRD